MIADMNKHKTKMFCNHEKTPAFKIVDIFLKIWTIHVHSILDWPTKFAVDVVKYQWLIIRLFGMLVTRMKIHLSSWNLQVVVVILSACALVGRYVWPFSLPFLHCTFCLFLTFCKWWYGCFLSTWKCIV